MNTKMKNAFKKLFVACLLVLLVTSSFGTIIFAQDYLYNSKTRKYDISIKPGWNRLDEYGTTYWYYGDENGDRVTGWKKINGSWYAFIGGNGVPREKELWVITWTGFGVNTNGQMLSGGSYPISSYGYPVALYSFKDSGAMVTGWYKNKNQKWYYHDPNTGAAVDGWQKIGGKWYYFTKGQEVTRDTYFRDYIGCEMQTGWVNDGGTWYYMNSSGAMQTGWVRDRGKWYYMNSDGAMQTGWNFIGWKWYYMDDPGNMVTGWKYINGSWYYMNSSGAMCTGWQKINGLWYYFKSSGAMAAFEWCDGYWLSSSGAWTYQPKGSWKLNDNGWWFGDTSGWYAKNESVKINDVEYLFNEKGYLIDSVPLRFDSGIYYQKEVLSRVIIGWDFSLLNKNSDIPQSKLALASLVLSANIYDWNLIKDTLSDMGFSKFVRGNDGTYDDINRVGYVIASTTQMIGGRKTNVIAVVCRGSATSQDWESNILQQAAGFRIAANNVRDDLYDYLYTQNIDTSLPTKLLITGHSRGGAVANILATDVWGITDDANVFAYTFACPNTTTDNYRSYYYNIFNICIEGDPVPALPAMVGGNNKFGQTISLKASVNDPAFIKAFQGITGGASTTVLDSSDNCSSSYPLALRHHAPAVYMAALLEPNGTAAGYNPLSSTINQKTSYELKQPISK